MIRCINCPSNLPQASAGHWLGAGNVGPLCDVCWTAVFEWPTRGLAFEAVSQEREYQERRWTGPRHTEITPYLVFIRHYLRRAEDLASTLNCDAPLNKVKVMDVVRKIAALAVAAMEEHGVVSREQTSAR